MAELIEDTTEPLANGAPLPEHSGTDTARKIVEYGRVWDDANGITLMSGMLHENEVRMLQMGHNMALGHLYCYAIRDKKIYHTRNLVVIDVKCREET